MVDSKTLLTEQLGLDEKKGLGEIPPPVQQQNVNTRKSRWATLLKHLALLSVISVCLVYWTKEFRAEVDAEASAWLANPFTFPHFHHGKHKILNGKPAEKLFL